ncbi:YdcF family protein [Pontibacter diazotrophicus]|uniref:YdcF family protein n=1 Tax=Pontibacter diazotrophicus TaxID=1400979 RepID=A0A3D8LIR4_9BACT|nr:YdcF family protein [Pontibacter diazotrophicus]RDV16782.1 YdcF family protein [Pontibacter diazotrophicus]
MIEELIIRTLCDTLPEEPADALFIFGQTEDNQESVFAVARQLLQQKRAKKLLFLNTGPISGYPGFESWEKALVNSGVGVELLEPVPPVPADTDILHTGIEAESLMAHALKQQYKHLIVTASPFQQPRAFMAAVTAALQSYPELHIYSHPGKALPWKEEVVHSQGKVQAARAGLIAGEMKRIRKYHEKGDLASVEDVIVYLNKRDTGYLSS